MLSKWMLTLYEAEGDVAEDYPVSGLDEIYTTFGLMSRMTSRMVAG